jgi:hypothetical protein
MPSMLPIAYPFPSPKHEIELVADLSGLSCIVIGSKFPYVILLRSQT